MKIKLQAMLNGVAALREQYGAEAVEAVLATCDAHVRERCETGIAIEWHDVEEFCQFLNRAERELGRGDQRISEMIGAAGAETHTRSWFKRAAMSLASPEFIFSKVTSSWRRFNDQGNFEMDELVDGRCLLSLSGVDVADPLFCATITGWAGVMAKRVGWNPARVEHIECRGRADDRCVWRTTWPPKK